MTEQTAQVVNLTLVSPTGGDIKTSQNALQVILSPTNTTSDIAQICLLVMVNKFCFPFGPAVQAI